MAVVFFESLVFHQILFVSEKEIYFWLDTLALVIMPSVIYRGANAQTAIKVIIVTGIKALAKASLMFQKICNYLSILSTVLVLGILGGGFFTYKYVTSEQFKAKMMNQVLENVQGLMGNVLEKNLPDLTGPSLPIPPTLNKPKI